MANKSVRRTKLLSCLCIEIVARHSKGNSPVFLPVMNGTLVFESPPIGLPVGRSGGRGIGAECRVTSRYCKGPSHNPEKSHLPLAITEYLGNFCLHKMPNGRLSFVTEFVSVNIDLLCAHPSSNGRPWNDHAMMMCFQPEAHLSSFIHTFFICVGY
jgi:hypothetical protein